MTRIVARAAKTLSGDDFKVWRLSRGLSQAEVGRWFGVTYQAVAHLEKSGLTQMQALAISAIEHGLKPWTPTDLDRSEAEKAGEVSDEEPI